MKKENNKIAKKKESNVITQVKETRLRVNEETDLMTFLLSKMGGMKRNSIKSLLGHRQILVNNEITTQYNLPLKSGDTVVVSSVRGNVELFHPKMKIIFEDPYLIAVEKKEGLLTVKKDSGNQLTAFSILKKHVQKSSKHHRVYTVHRLDRDSSGVLVFAKSQEVHEAFYENWHRDVKKRVYVAVVEGEMEKKVGEIVRPAQKKTATEAFSDDADNLRGKQAPQEMESTSYRVIKSNDEYSLLEIELKAGQKNQIRYHLSAAGHPIVGDKKYGSKINPMGRMGLHARILEFYHPVTKKRVVLETVVPRKFLHLFHNLEQKPKLIVKEK